MSYTLNSVNLSTYGIVPGHAPNSNIALQGCFDLPSRTGKCFHEWGDSDGIEPYVNASEIIFAGRDIVFYGSILGTNILINTYLKLLYDAIKAFTGLVTFSTPYGSFSVFVKEVNPEIFTGGAKIVMTLREPVVSLTGGSLPATGASNYKIDSIPFSSFGLYLSKSSSINDLPQLKEQFFTKYGSEGYQISKRTHNKLQIDGFVSGTSLTDFQNKIKALYLVFSSTGTRTVILNDEITITCFSTEGFKVENILLHSAGVIANINISLICDTVTSKVLVFDADGNTYNSITIGSQTWLLENLKTTKFNNGDSISNVTDNTAWAALSTPAYCDHGNAPENSVTYGRLYNWFTINDARGICPAGYHIATNAEWTQLLNYLAGGVDWRVVGNKVKEAGTVHWTAPNTGANNSSGFTALGAGARYAFGIFDTLKDNGIFWTKTEYPTDPTQAYLYSLAAVATNAQAATQGKTAGHSIRCIKD